jgi:hypothetical protein
MLVVLRCIPCEECVKLDDELVDSDPVIRPLLEKFVCARQISTNGLDLSLFQFDTDQSFAIFMLNNEGTIYGRFGTRSHRTEWLGDVSLAGLAKALAGALELHAAFPANRAALAGKRGKPLEVATPEKFSAFRGKYADQPDYDGDVVRTCIHCHQIGDARREQYRSHDRAMPERLLFPFPHPKVIGLTLDPDEMATVKSVEKNSAAERAGFRVGDQIRTLAGQPLLSIADLQWVLDTADPQGTSIAASVEREGKPIELALQLEDGWRTVGDISWRVSSWGLRRMTTGGLLLDLLPAEERDRLSLEVGQMALRVKHVGQYGPHAAAKKAGFRKGDLIVEFDGRRDLLSETALLAYGATHQKAGNRVNVVVLREGEEIRLTLPMQD